MLFNSFEFIFALLPLSAVVYFLTARFLPRAAIWWLVAVSLFFYGWWRPADLPLFAASILFNFAIGRVLNDPARQHGRRWWLGAGIGVNLLVLAAFKYGRFFTENAAALTGAQFAWPDLVLPLGISFFTFTQITYLVDSYHDRGGRYPLSTYGLFASFYPHLLAGPILHHGDMIPQFLDERNRALRLDNLWRGAALFCLGLSKKVLLADPLSEWVRAGFDAAESAGPSLLDAWLTALAYTFQIYFDFSGYTDMAIGAALLFNVRLPFNFNSPYRARDIQEFWRRWHITLGTFFRDYVYIRLGGNRLGRGRTLVNLFGVALLSGLWHGAAWSFVLWGALHGGAMVIHHLWKGTGWKLPGIAGWAIMAVFIVVTWVPFRAASTVQMNHVLGGLAGQQGVVLPASWRPEGKALNRFFKKYHVRWRGLQTARVPELLGYLAAAGAVALWPRNSNRLADPNATTPIWQIAGLGLLGAWSILNLDRISEFIYFNF